MVKKNKEAIAIIGMSCRFPDVYTLDDFWNLLREGRDTINEISKERWDVDELYDPDPLSERKTHQRHASLLSDIHNFDPLFFNISPAEAIEMSPSQKLMLELAWESIENSSVPYDDVKGKKVGVFVGNIWNDFEHFRKEKNARATLHSAVGMSMNVIANRVSFAMGFTGPSLVVDTGCSASLVALHFAFQSLISGESEMSIVGGINHIMDPGKYVELTRFGGLSLKGKCSTFDAEADGFVRGEGGGALFLKRLSDAEQDGDKILAVIRGTAVNNNGFNDTLPATSTEGQKALLKEAYEKAGIRPNEVHYVEAHGTGTKLGDPNEAKAIGEFFRQGRATTPLRVGSIKTNIGHTEATAGIAGIIKVVLAMQNKMLPPNLNFNRPNPNIPFEELKIEVQSNISAWPVSGTETFKAGVNSFGWGGTNAHAVVEQYVHENKSDAYIGTNSGFNLPVSAKSSSALYEYVKAYAELLKHSDEQTFRETCIATAIKKPAFDHRVCFMGKDRIDLLDDIEVFLNENMDVLPVRPCPPEEKVVFVFPGQGAQWLGMGCGLFQTEPVFRKSIEECDKAFQPYTDWSLIDELYATPEKSRLQEINVIQPAICAMQVALARLWISWGVKPHAVIGHSMGEVAAAHIAGVLDLKDMAKIICSRSKLMRSVSGKGGAMAVTELTKEEAKLLIGKYDGKLSIAVNNSPKSTVLAGDQASINEVITELENKGLFCRLIKVDVASHSPQMDPLMEPLKEMLQGLRPQKSQVPFFSTVLGKEVPGDSLDESYWVSNLRGTVQFAASIDELLAQNYGVFVEANPHPVLMNAINECAEANRAKIIAVASTFRDQAEYTSMLRNFGSLFCKGYPIDWQKFYKSSKIPHVPLPPYPFQRERYEIEDLSGELELAKGAPARFPLLGNKINLAQSPNMFFWESFINVDKFPYLKDHEVHGRIQVPISFFIEMAMEAVITVKGMDQVFRLEDMAVSENVFISENQKIDLQTKLTWDSDETGIFQIFIKDNKENDWRELANVKIVLEAAVQEMGSLFEEIEYRENSYTEGINYYNLLRNIGFNYGKHFHQLTGLDNIESTPFNTILFSVKPDHTVNVTSGKYIVHPALISSFFHPLLGQLTGILEDGNYLQMEFEQISLLQMHGPVDYNREIRGMMMVNKLSESSSKEKTWDFEAEVLIANSDNSAVMTIKGLKGRATKFTPVKNDIESELFSSFDDVLASLGSEEEKLEAIQKIIVHHVSKIIKIAPNRIKATMTFKGMGVDSLMAVQLRNLLEKDFSAKLPVGMFWAHPSILDYAIYLKNLLTEFDGPKKEGNPQWFQVPNPKPDAAVRLFCFHDAGGSASLFEGWEKILEGVDIEFVTVEMPGRGRRLDEDPYVDVYKMLNDLIPEILPLLNKPYVFLGHSMGGMVAFEIIRNLRKKGKRLPEILFISSTSGLTAYEKNQVDFSVDNDTLVEMYPHLDLNVLGDEELQKMLVQILRADLQLLYNYQYEQEAPLNIPIVAIHGNEDVRVLKHQIGKWEDETSGPFELISRSGGHRYIEHDAAFVAQLIVQKLFESQKFSGEMVYVHK